MTRGYFTDQISGTGYYPHVPLGFYLGGTWINQGMSPVSDMNSRGQIVGTSMLSYGGSLTYAAFSAPNGSTHDLAHIANSKIADNLNSYINGTLGINLTDGLKVDDLGRIIAGGTVDGRYHDFLLTPDGVVLATATPEPSRLFLWGFSGCVGLQLARNRRNRAG